MKFKKGDIILRDSSPYFSYELYYEERHIETTLLDLSPRLEVEVSYFSFSMNYIDKTRKLITNIFRED